MSQSFAKRRDHFFVFYHVLQVAWQYSGKKQAEIRALI
jgi:hypothetical protein